MSKDTPSPDEGTTRYPGALESFSTDMFGGLANPVEHTLPDGTVGHGTDAESAYQDAIDKSSK
jgi:hypothetical protein